MRNRIAELEAEVEERRQEYNERVAEYEDALSYPDLFDVDLAKVEMEDAKRWYEEAKDELECEIEWQNW